MNTVTCIHVCLTLDELVGLFMDRVPEYIVVNGMHLLHRDVRGMHGDLDLVVGHVVGLNGILKAQRNAWPG